MDVGEAAGALAVQVRLKWVGLGWFRSLGVHVDVKWPGRARDRSRGRNLGPGRGWGCWCRHGCKHAEVSGRQGIPHCAPFVGPYTADSALRPATRAANTQITSSDAIFAVAWQHALSKDLVGWCH